MRAIILSAGQGRRLLPLTEHAPKCMLDVKPGVSVLQLQLRTLAACGVDHASVIVGFRADQVERSLAEHPVPGIETKLVYNPFFAVSDNLATAWMARSEMQDEFILLNGDTLFDAAVLRGLLASPPAPLTLATDEKPAYDDDDMKVSLGANRRLTAVGKTLAPENVDGESIGLMLFRGQGPAAFRDALDAAIRDPAALKLWYLSVVNELAGSLEIATSSVCGSWWAEIDSPEDLAEVRATLAAAETGPATAASRAAG
jgi:choline kinase